MSGQRFYVHVCTHFLMSGLSSLSSIEAPLSARSALRYLGNFIVLLTAFMWPDLTRAYRASEGRPPVHLSGGCYDLVRH
jgi:hypothetical protein